MQEERLIAVETKLAFQEDTIQELNRIVFRQQQRLEQLETTCRTLVDRSRTLSEEIFADQPINKKPPHY